MSRFFALFLLCVLPPFASAQTFSLNVQVVDEVTSEGLPFANVYLKGAGMGSTTNLEGLAKILLQNEVQGLDTLICSYVGYEKQAVPLDLPLNERLVVALSENAVRMEEVLLTYKKPLTAKQILQQAKKRISDNYPQDHVGYTAFYRETMQENGHYTHLNEAWLKLYASPYPQKLDRKAWLRWYHDDAYLFEYNGATWFHQIIHHFNHETDQIHLLEARSSANHSPNRFDPILRSGPGEMTALDLVKFQCDFLYSRNFKRYDYTLKDNELIRGRSCYVIQFHPLESGRRMVFDMGKKLTRSIYVGRVYVDMATFAIVKMDYKLAQNVDYGFHQPRIPLDYQVTFDFKMEGTTWHPDRVKLVQVIPAANKFWGATPLLMIGCKELIYTDTQVEDVQPFAPDEVWKFTRWTSLRDHPFPYRKPAWDSLQAQIPPLPSEITQDLEKETPLPEQFPLRFQQRKDMLPPSASSQDFSFDYPLESLSDPYQWLAQPDSQKALFDYVLDENEYASNHLIPYREYQKRTFKAIDRFFLKDTTQDKRAHQTGDIVMEEDSLRQNILYEFSSPTEKHPILNTSEFLGKRPGSFLLGIRPAKSYLAVDYAVQGGSEHCLIVLTKGSQRVLDSIPKVYQFAWLTDSTLLYVQEDDARRGSQLFLLNVHQGYALFLKEEVDPTFDLGLATTENHVLVSAQSKEENEIFVLQKGKAAYQPICIHSRQAGVEVSMHEFNDSLYLLTDQDAPNRRIEALQLDWESMTVTQTPFEAEKQGRRIQDFVVTDHFLVLRYHEGSFEKLAFRPLSGRKWKPIKISKAISSYYLSKAQGDQVNIYRSNPSTPGRTYLFDLPTESHTLVRQDKVHPRHHPGQYETKRLWAKAPDGTKVPMTVSWNRFPTKKHKGLVLKAYGAYGAIQSSHFRADDALLMRDGFKVVYAHIRGGGLMGEIWYEEGKMLEKENSFSDYIACAEHLIEKGLTDPDHLIGYGVSAGGLVMGVVTNRRPELFNTIVLDHPFLDVLTTMMDPSLPLTTDEYKEWGNPMDSTFYHCQKGYSPYHNIRQQAYPNLLFLAGMQDFQTPTWQIAKHVARIRQAHTGDQTILFYTDLVSGHKGNVTGKMWIKDIGMVHSFIYGNLFGSPTSPQ